MFYEQNATATVTHYVHQVTRYCEKHPSLFEEPYNFKVKYSKFPKAELLTYRYLLFTCSILKKDKETEEDKEFEAFLKEQRDTSDNQDILDHFYYRIWKWNDDKSPNPFRSGGIDRHKFAEKIGRVSSGLHNIMRQQEPEEGIDRLILFEPVRDIGGS
jgi:hypothetical protein